MPGALLETWVDLSKNEWEGNERSWEKDIYVCVCVHARVRAKDKDKKDKSTGR